MKINKLSILYFSLEIITRFISYFFSYVLYLPILRVIPSTPLLILAIFPNINFRRALNSVLPYALFSIFYQIFYIIIYGDTIFSIYKSILLFLQYFGLILIFEVIDKNYSEKWKNTLPNLALIMLFIQVIGYSISPVIPKTQLFSTNVISWGNLILFNKFFPDSQNKLNIFDFLKAILSLFFMSVIGSRACIFIAICILFTAFSLRLINFLTKSNGIYKLYFKKILDNKLKNLLIFVSLLIIPYYLFFNIFINYFFGEKFNPYEYITQIENCTFYYNDKSKINNNRYCDLLSEQIFFLSDPSGLIRTLSDINTINNILKSPIKLIIPIKDKVNESDNGLRNYLNRSHNLLISNIGENGIIGILFIFFTISKYDNLLREKNFQLNFISPFLLFLGIFLSNDIFPLFPLLLYTRKIKNPNQKNLK